MPTRTTSGRAGLAPLYEQLRPLRNGPGREEVGHHQRARLFAAMIEAVAGRGYDEVTVTELRSLAGVSKRTVYDHFPSKEAYFLATYDLVVYRAVKRMRSAYAGSGEWLDRMHSSLEALLEEVQEQPKPARLALIHAPRAGRAARERTERAARTFEQMVNSSFAESPQPVTLDPVVAKGIVGGITSALRLATARGGVLQPAENADQLLQWILSYRANVGWTPQPHSRREISPYLQREVTQLDRETHAQDEVGRVLNSALRIAASNGFETLTVAQVVQSSASSDARFFDHFDNCEQCLLSAVERRAIDACAQVALAVNSSPDWMAGLRLGIRALVEYLAENPAFARVAFVEILSLGSAEVNRADALAEQLSSCLTSHVPTTEIPSQMTMDAITGAIWESLRSYFAVEPDGTLSTITDQIAYLMLAPLIGPVRSLLAISGFQGSESGNSREASEPAVMLR